MVYVLIRSLLFFFYSSRWSSHNSSSSPTRYRSTPCSPWSQKKAGSNPHVCNASACYWLQRCPLECYLHRTPPVTRLNIARVCSVRYVPRHTAGTYRRYIPPVLPVPATWVSSVRHQYRYRTLRKVRYNINTGTGHSGKFSTTSIPVPDTSVSSVQYQYRYRTLR